jgi:hypothetical protein
LQQQLAAAQSRQAEANETSRLQLESERQEAEKLRTALDERQQQLAAAQSRQAESDEASRLRLEGKRHEAEQLRALLDERGQLLNAAEGELQHDARLADEQSRTSERARSDMERKYTSTAGRNCSNDSQPAAAI